MKKGVVYLIGAGPGSPDLISLRGLHLLRQAEMIVIDSLLPETFLDDLDIPCKQVLRMHASATSMEIRQQEINNLLLDGARRGLRVARLKGGDPMVFGRGWEEVAFLDSHGVAWEVVPGISSAMAAPASASVPLTTRRSSRSVAFVTARLAGGDANKQMPKADTIIVLMGMKVLPSLAQRLMDEGRSPDTPACIIERGCQPGERHVKATLATIADAAEKAGLKPPGIVVVGGGAGRPDLIHPRKRILFMGIDPAPFRPLGEILHWPVQTLVPKEVSLKELALPEAIVFTDAPAVRRFFSLLHEEGRDARLLANVTIAASSPAARRELTALKLRVDLPPKGGSLVVEGAPSSSEALQLFDARPGPLLGRPLPEHDVVFFTRPEEAKLALETYGKEAFRGEVWCSSDTAAAYLESQGLAPVRVHEPGA